MRITITLLVLFCSTFYANEVFCEKGKIDNKKENYTLKTVIYDDAELAITVPVSNGMRNGTAVVIGRFGKPIIEIPFTDDIVNGVVKNYTEVGHNIRSEFEYKNNVKHGLYKIYLLKFGSDSVPTLSATGYYKNGVIDGKQIHYNDDGINIELIEYYKNGKLNGPKIYYWDNESIKHEIIYKKGKKNGLERRFNKYGELREEGLFVDGKEEGLHKAYHDNGMLWYETTYKNGRIIGVEKKYNSNGFLYSEDNYSKDGLKDGDHIFYYKSGLIKLHEKYKKGVIKSYKRYYETGDLKEKVKFKNGKAVSGYFIDKNKKKRSMTNSHFHSINSYYNHVEDESDYSTFSFMSEYNEKFDVFKSEIMEIDI